MFIVIEGIDGAGCETQAKMVADSLKNHRVPSVYTERSRSEVEGQIELIKFPHYDTPVGKMIKDFLYLNQKMKAHEQFLLYTLQIIFDEEEIRQKSGKSLSSSIYHPSSILIADRYFTTTLCYQTLDGFDEKS